MKLRIDGRFIALQALGCIACYALGVLIVFAICNVNDPVGFIPDFVNVSPKIRR